MHDVITTNVSFLSNICYGRLFVPPSSSDAAKTNWRRLASLGQEEQSVQATSHWNATLQGIGLTAGNNAARCDTKQLSQNKKMMQPKKLIADSLSRTVF